MNKKILTVIVAVCATAFALTAEVPSGYYESLDGLKTDALKEAVRKLSQGHEVVSYGSNNPEGGPFTWMAFEKTDIRKFQGHKIWWDMYSNNIVYYPGHDALNIEHSVANSWWGAKAGSREAYSDLFLLNPSDSEANGKKSDMPIAEVATASYDNGLSKIGTPVQGQGGGSKNVFEPADEYKGDFARSFFYVFSAYNDLTTWKETTQYMYDSNCELQPWAVELLLKWHRDDPVDSKEMKRNDEIYKFQGNRNPFIDYPELAEYIWGEKKGENVSISTLRAPKAIDRPEAPTFDGSRPVGVNTYTARWWDGFRQAVDYTEGELMLSLDGRDYYSPLSAGVEFDAAVNASESHVIKAYTIAQVEGYSLRSPISTLTLRARDPQETEYTTARWEKLTADARVELGDEKWVVLAANTCAAMSCTGGTSSNSFMTVAGLTNIEDDYLVELPVDAALVEFKEVGNGKYQMMLSDMKGNYKGSWNASAKNKMKLDANTYTPGAWSMGDNDTFVFTFDQNGRLQYNMTQPRFLNYESNQGGVFLYRYVDMNGGFTPWDGTDYDPDDTGGIGEVTQAPWAVGIDGNNIIAPEGTVIYDLNGRRVHGTNLGHGMYIVVGPGRSVKVMI